MRPNTRRDSSLIEAIEASENDSGRFHRVKGGIVATTLCAHQIGATAYAEVLDLDRSWSVLASVSGAIYIESDVGEIVWLAASASALHPRAIQLAGMPTDLPTVGTVCTLMNRCLHVGEMFVVKLGDVPCWRPELKRLRNHEDAPEAALRIIAAIDQAALRSSPRGLLTSVVFPHAPRSCGGSLTAVDQELVATASRAIEVLRQAPTEFDLLGRLQNAIELIGLGLGLTPSGDDLLGGFLYTLHVLDSPDWRSRGLDWAGVDGWLSQVRLLTNKISFTILADLARGDAAELLNGFLNAALNGESTECLVRAAGRVSAIGQSSGWDMLAGVYCACSVVERMVGHDSACDVVPTSRAVARKMRQEHERLKEVVHVC